MGRTNEVVTKHFTAPDGSKVSREVELFTWEKLDYVDQIKTAFGL
jgi:S-adenosylmethionine synthetase